MKILVLNGPNMNMLGIRQPEIYGKTTYADLVAMLQAEADKLGVEITTYYATEIDKYAIQTTQHNFPNTVQLGDAFQVRDPAWCLPRKE